MYEVKPFHLFPELYSLCCLLTFQFLVCGVTLSEESGEVMSPSYPQNYIRDIACSYTITQYPGKITSLTFVDFEVGSKVDDECINDYVEVMLFTNSDRLFRTLNTKYLIQVMFAQLLTGLNVQTII